MTNIFTFALEHASPYSHGIQLLCHAFTKAGWHLYSQTHAAASHPDSFVTLVTIADHPLFNTTNIAELMIMHTDTAMAEWLPHTSSGAIIVSESTMATKSSQSVIPLDVQSIARKASKDPAYADYVSAGMAMKITGLSLRDTPSYFQLSTSQRDALEAGYVAVPLKPAKISAAKNNAPAMVVNGYQALTSALLSSGIRYMAWQEEIAQIALALLNQQTEQPVHCQPVDSANLAIAMAGGAAHAGARAVAVISGDAPDMHSAYRQAILTETPTVIVSVVSESSQQSIEPTLSSTNSQLVFTPTNPVECWIQLTHAANLTELLQMPVTVRIEESILRQSMSVSDINTLKHTIERGKLVRTSRAKQSSTYDRYSPQADGLSPRKVPGQPGPTFATFADTSPVGQSKRSTKLKNIQPDILPYVIHGNAAKNGVIIIASGSITGPARAAAETLGKNGIQTSVLQINQITPISHDEIRELLRGGQYYLAIDTDTTKLCDVLAHSLNLPLKHRAIVQPGPGAEENIIDTVMNLFSTHQEIRK